MGEGDRVSGGRGCTLRVRGFTGLASVRVQKVQMVQRFDTAFAREGCGGRLHGHALAGVRVQKVQRVQRFDTAFGREGCGGRLRRQNDKTFTTTLLA